MRNGLIICLGNALLMLGVSAQANPAPADLRALLSIGTTNPQSNLKWGTGREEVQSLFPALSPTTFALGLYSIQGATTYRGCTFKLRLDSEINPKPQGALSSAHADYATGNLDKCRHGLESALAALYGQPKITRHPAGWPDGSGPPATVLMDWSSPSTCIDPWWEGGEGKWGPSLRLTLNAKGQGCGGYDDQAVTPGR
jgi:hypothetical protein